ncbi:MAG: NGG1p interacting factor NIF3 [Candidatus Berkelbacteria bacterium]|nr:NGG1p interacting factor NIF3 [Candidatus Berkelbacteria bacterium]
MKVQEIFDLAIKVGIENDPRGTKEVANYLKSVRKDYSELPEKKKKEFDKEKLTNPYSDSKFQAGDKNKAVKRVMVGIDIGTGGVLLAKELERQGKKIDLIIAHHPVGKALADLHEVMDLQTSVYAKGGVPENIAEGILREGIESVARRIAPVNHYESPMTAELLGISMINIHTPADNAVWKFVSDYIEKKNLKRVGELVDILKEIPEYKKATELGAGPVIFSGSEKSRLGKVLVSGMTGGTDGKAHEKLYERMAHYGIGTEVAMHVGDEDRDEAIKHYINIVIAGHIASDSLGLNIIMDELEKKGIEIIPCSGYIRYSRVKK